MGDEELRKNFRDNLNYYLTVNGYTQADMARYMRVSTTTTAKWCTGQAMPRIDKIQSLCNWLDIEKSDLLEPRIVNAKKSSSQGVTVPYNSFDYSLLSAYHSASEHEQQIVNTTLRLNPETQEEEREEQPLLAAHERTDVQHTEKGKKHDIDLMMNDDEWK